VAPKKAALAAAEELLEATMSQLREKQAVLKAVEDELGGLQSQFDAATQRKKDLEDQVRQNSNTIIIEKTSG
jgi:dynein heavy chain, axonemal